MLAFIEQGNSLIIDLLILEKTIDGSPCTAVGEIAEFHKGLCRISICTGTPQLLCMDISHVLGRRFILANSVKNRFCFPEGPIFKQCLGPGVGC